MAAGARHWPRSEVDPVRVEMVELFRRALQDAHERGQIGTRGDEGVALLSVLQAGIISQQMANEPGAPVSEGRFTSLLPEAIRMFVAAFPPEPKRAKSHAQKG